MSTKDEKIYLVSIERLSLGNNLKFHDHKGATEILQEMLDKEELFEGIDYEIYGPWYYDDMTIRVRANNSFQAILIGVWLDTQLPESSPKYAYEYHVRHNASVTGPWKECLDEYGNLDMMQGSDWKVHY